MPRGSRQFEIGGIYHVLNRGVEKRKIFLKNQDYSRFVFALEFFNNEESINLWELLATKAGTVPALKKRLEIVRRHSRRPIVDVLAFVLMPNHYHLVLREISYGGISSFMRKIGGYSTYFNKQYERVGALFQSRYKAVPIKTNDQLHTVFAYVHTNPVGLIEPLWKEYQVRNLSGALSWLKKYRWSSYHDYAGIPTFQEVIQRDFFDTFYGSERKGIEAIEDWVKSKAERAKLEGSIGPEILE